MYSVCERSSSQSLSFCSCCRSLTHSSRLGTELPIRTCDLKTLTKITLTQRSTYVIKCRVNLYFCSGSQLATEQGQSSQPRASRTLTRRGFCVLNTDCHFHVTHTVNGVTCAQCLRSQLASSPKYRLNYCGFRVPQTMTRTVFSLPAEILEL